MVVNPVYPYHRAGAPASFLHSTAIDMCHRIITSLNGGESPGKRILSADKYPLMWAPVAPRSYPPFYEHAGLGWTLGTTTAGKRSHTAARDLASPPSSSSCPKSSVGHHFVQ